MKNLAVWSIFIYSSVDGQEIPMTPNDTVHLNTITGVVNWPSMRSADQNSLWVKYDSALTTKTYQNFSSVVEASKEYVLYGNRCYMYGSLTMEKIDVTFELYYDSDKTTDWYQQLEKWGNSSKSITDEEVSLALDAAFSSSSSSLLWKIRLISLTMESAKPSGPGFETLAYLNNVGYALMWSGKFGGTFSDPFHNTNLLLVAQNKQHLINFTKVTRIDLVGQTIRIVADRVLLTLEVSSINLPLINASITEGTLKMQGLKSIESSNATSANPSLVSSLHAWWGVQYWPSVGTSEKRVSDPDLYWDKYILEKTYGSSTIHITQNLTYDLEGSCYLYGTASLEQIDIEIYPLDLGFQKKSWHYRIFQNWGNSSTRPITDEEISMAMDSLLLSTKVAITNISSESITGLGNGFESFGDLKTKWGRTGYTTYAQKWKGTFGGSFSFLNGNLKLKPFSNQRILKFLNITKVELKGDLIRIVAAKAILSLDVTQLATSDGIATVNRGSLTLVGLVSQTGFFVEHPIQFIAIITGTITFLLFLIYMSVRYLKRQRYLRRQRYIRSHHNIKT
ncbi:hypothetical protein BC833DRAFT_648646 [Globomyces pollinis-pini]|nr:hypothetical protein BC833DRAFT_648646 [Globomyces pollinis-pini]